MPEPMTAWQRERLTELAASDALPQPETAEKAARWLETERTMEQAFRAIRKLQRRIAEAHGTARPKAAPDDSGPPPWAKWLHEPTADREGTHA